MPYKRIDVNFTNRTKEIADMLVELGIYGDLDKLASTAVRYLIKQREKALSLRQKAFSKTKY